MITHRRMSFLADWNRPSTLLLAGILAANLVLPLMHFWPEDAGADEGPVAPETAPAEPSAAAAQRLSAPPAVPLRTPADERSEAAGGVVEPIVMALRDKRPLPRQQPRPQPQDIACRAWGPFPTPDEAEAVAAELGLEPGSFEVRTSEVPGRPDYLVKVHARGSREAVAEVIAALGSREVDSYVLDRQQQESVLAAGVFRNPARAEIQRRTVAELGYEVVVETLDRSQRVYHLTAHVRADGELGIPAAGACRDIAPPGGFL